MLLTIHTLKGIKFEGQVLLLNAKTLAGEITVLDNHLPLISILRPGTLRVVEKNKVSEIQIRRGFLEVRPQNRVNILADL